jgi:hypothetical protein
MSLIRYIDCDNAYEDFESALKATLVFDTDTGQLIGPRIFDVSDSDLPVSALTEIQCGDNLSIADIWRHLLAYDESGNLGWLVYNTS